MPNTLLMQGKESAWLVDDFGRALVKIVEGSGVSDSDNAVRYDQVSDTVAYVGKAVAGTAGSSALWQIKKLTLGSDGDVTVEFADGNADFDNIWDNRISLIYS